MSGESNTDRGDSRHPGRPHPADGPHQRSDTGLPQQPATGHPPVASGWRGASSWLNPTSEEQPTTDPESDAPGGSSSSSVSGTTSRQTSGSVPQVSQPRPSSVPDPDPEYPTTKVPGVARPAGDDSARYPAPPEEPARSQIEDPDDDVPTEVIDSGELTRRLAAGPASWPGHPNNPTSNDILGHGKSDAHGSAGKADAGKAGLGSLSELRAKVGNSPRARRGLLIAAAVVGVAVVGYIADLVVTSGTVPRGVEVAGVELGGLDQDQARTTLQSALDARAGETVPVQLDEVQDQLVPGTAGLGLDWEATQDRIGGQSWNPVSRLLSFVTTREVPVASSVDDAALNRTLDELSVHDEPAVEGAIEFEGARPVEVAPITGRVMDRPAARATIIDEWATANTLELPVVTAEPAVRQDAIEQALHQIAEPSVSAPVVYSGKGGVHATLSPEQIADIVRFVPDGNGGLQVEFDHKVATDLLAVQLEGTEVEPKDATFTFSGGAPTVVPAVVGDKVNWEKSFEQLPTMLAAAGAERTAPAVYERAEPELTTEAAEGLGITEVMGEFTTSGFSGPSGVNIRTVAQEVTGAVVRPGETFSLNGYTGHRGKAEGYVESGIIDHGRPSEAVGGGISQFATTLYNAAYFAGLEDAGHTEHSYYISRYPEAREATVFDGAIDLKFRNNTPHGLYIQAFADSSEVTVQIWGTKTVEVESFTGERSKPTDPETIRLPEGDDCIASTGAPGFTTSNTRVISDINTGAEISRTTRTVKYDPVPEVICESPEDKEPDDHAQDSSEDSGPGSR